jgi:hypothetical protein
MKKDRSERQRIIRHEGISSIEGDRDTIEFHFNGNKLDAYFSSQPGAEGLTIVSDTGIIVKPAASNMVRIRFED